MAKVDNFPELSNDSRSFQASAYESGKQNFSNPSMQVFNNPNFGNVRTVIIDNEPWFVGKDVAIILGYANTSQAIQVNVDEDDARVIQLSDLQDGLSDRLPDHMKGSKITIINESGLYSLILRSEKPEAKEFKKWITSEVLPSIRKTGLYSTKTLRPVIPSTSADYVFGFNAYIAGLKANLNISDISAAGLYSKLAISMGYPEVDYVPSKGVLKSATDLLKENGVQMSAIAFNKIAVNKGVLIEMSRKSSHGIKKFKNISDDWLSYGENQVNPNNPRETQPLWYVGKFPELLKKMDII